MKVSEITVQNVANFLRLDEVVDGSADYLELEAILDSAKEYVSDYTGIPQVSTVDGEKTIDDYSKFYIAIMALCTDMYENRQTTTDKGSSNKVIESILGMHCRNLL